MRRLISSSAFGAIPLLFTFAFAFASGIVGAQPAPSGPLASGLAALAASDYPKAESELAQVKGPAEAEAKLALARAALAQGKYADAEKHVQAASASPALKARATLVRASILTAEGKTKDAIQLVEPLAKGGKTAEARRARLMLGEALIGVGRRSDADDPLKKVIQDYNDDTIDSNKDAEGLAEAGRAAFLLRSRKDASKLFKDSESIDKKRVETLLWEAELLLDVYNPGDAGSATKEALDLAPKNADALVMMARVKLDNNLDFDDAEKLVKEALAVNPHHTGAFAVRAGLALRDMDIAATDKAVAEGLATNPNDLELLSLKAASRFLDDDPRGFDAQKKEVLARNGSFSHFFGIVGEYAEWEHRYDDIVTMMREATKVDPDDAKAWAELGLTQMRSGDEDKGLEAIKKAWSKDHFNIRVYNTLEKLYEKDIPRDYELVTDGIFKIRYAKDEKPILERYVPRMLGEAWASMKARYGFVPKSPVQVELYANRQHFSIRTSGLPNIGIQGVCFGTMIAAISPEAEPFNWGNVVWHELGHVFAIQMSKNHVPRWFTEGLSEYETIARRPEWARELDAELYQALTQNKLPGAVDMNRAFTHANDANDVTTAYYAASQMLVWTVERFGMKGVVKALELWGQGKRTPEVIRTAFGVSPEDYDKGYRDWQLARLSRYKNQYVFTLKAKEVDDAKRDAKDKPNDPAAHVSLAMAYLRSRKLADGKKELEAALALDPNFADAHFMSAKVALGEKDAKTAESHLDAMRSSGHDGVLVHMLLADIAEQKEDKAKLRYHLEAAYRLDPSQSEPLEGLLKLAREAKNDTDELDLLRKIAALEQHDKQVWRALLEKLVAKKAWDEARKVGEEAVFVDVTGGPTHVLYARALLAQKAYDGAAYEVETAFLAKMPPKEMATAHAVMAQVMAAQKRPADATKHRDEALKLDPENAEAKELKL